MATGISFPSSPVGEVSEYQQREAARFALYRWSDFEALPVSERVRIIAHYRAHSLVEMHESEAVVQDMNHKRNRGSRRPVTGSAR